MSEPKPRLFYAGPGGIAGDAVRLEGEEAAHLARVLRMKPGARCRVADPAGEEVLAELTAVSPGRAEGRVLERLPRRPAPPLSIRLGLPLVKGERFERVLEKGTELGVDLFHPLALDRCEVKIPPAKAGARAGRWRRLLREAAKQCDRVPPPEVRAPDTLASFIEETRDCPLKLLAHLGGARLSLAEALAGAPPRRAGESMPLALLTGPEGDLSPEEVGAACAAGFRAVNLGPRVLRADTAPIALVAIVQHVLGDMG